MIISIYYELLSQGNALFNGHLGGRTLKDPRVVCHSARSTTNMPRGPFLEYGSVLIHLKKGRYVSKKWEVVHHSYDFVFLWE